MISHKLLGTREWFVIHHTNCGMEFFTDEVIADLLDDSLETASFDGKAWSNPKHGGGAPHGHYIPWLTIADQADSVAADVKRIRSHPLVPRHIPIYGFVYDVATGRLNEVPTATAPGLPLERYRHRVTGRRRGAPAERSGMPVVSPSARGPSMRRSDAVDRRRR